MALSSCPKIGDSYNYLDNAAYVSLQAQQISNKFICSQVTNQGKLATDEEDIEASAKFMWIVNANYTDSSEERADWSSPRAYSNTSSVVSSAIPASSSVASSVSSSLPPWQELPTISFSPTKIAEMPIYKAYDNQGNLVNFTNKAGTWLKNSYDKYGLKISVNVSSASSVVWGYSRIVTNSTNFIIQGTTFPQKSLLLFPFGHSLKYWRYAGKIYKYYAYSFEMLYNPSTWQEEYLNAGIKGRCYSNRLGTYKQYAEQIYKYTWWDNTAVSGQYNYGGLDMMLDLQGLANAANLSAGFEQISYAYEAITEPVNLTTLGTVERATIEGGLATANFISYCLYPAIDFNTLFRGHF